MPPFTEEQERTILDTMTKIPNIMDALNKLTAAPPAPKKDDPAPKTDDKNDPILDKIKQDEENKKKALETTQEVERVIGFIKGVDEFITKNKDVLPADISKIVETANKETYETHADKASSIQASIMKSFFSVQENLDNLTGSQKKMVDDYLKLSQTARVQKASDIYNLVFEPAVSAAAQVKKAQELQKSKSGEHQSSKAEDAFVDKIRARSQEAYKTGPKK